MLKILPNQISQGKLHQYLVSSIGPRPIAFVSTIDKNGNHNLSPFSFFNVFSSNPPMVIFSPARRGKDNTVKHTYENVLEIPECVVNIVNYSMVEQMSLASTEYPKNVNEFIKSGFTAINSDLIKPMRVKESPVQMECVVKQVIELGKEGGAGNLVLAEIICLHISPDILTLDGHIDVHKIDLIGRLGGDWYCRASGQALFEVAKPLQKLGIGVDNIPETIRLSNVLTGNDLGKLGNVESMPDETEVNEYKLMELSEIFIEYEKTPELLKTKLHNLAHTLLMQNKVMEAWKTLLSYNE